MEVQNVVVIQDASREVNSKVFDWALHGLSLKPGDKVILVAVLHEVVTPMGYKISVDSRLMIGANKKIIDAQVAKKKEEYVKNEKIAEVFKLYKSKKVGFKVELATGSSPKAVALKSAMKLQATWVILDRKMKNDEEYFLQKLTCGISRIKRYNKIVRLRGPLDPRQETRHTTHETYTDSIPDMSTEPDLFSIEISPEISDNPKDYQMSQKQGERQISPINEVGCSALTFDSNQTGDKKHIDIKESHGYTTCGGSNNKEKQEQDSLCTEVYEEIETWISYCGAKNFFLEEVNVCPAIH